MGDKLPINKFCKKGNLLADLGLQQDWKMCYWKGDLGFVLCNAR